MTPEFRVWDKVNKVYDVPTQIDIDDSGHISIVDTYHGSLVYSDLVLEQYTGLKDVKGNEIFEGDIVKSGWVEMQYGGPDLVVEAEGEIVFEDGYFGVGNEKNEVRPLFTLTLNSLHIIGNVHENQELLEVDSK